MAKLYRFKQDIKINDREVTVLEKEVVASSEYFVIRQ
jgi:hypothetical protein